MYLLTSPQEGVTPYHAGSLDLVRWQEEAKRESKPESVLEFLRGNPTDTLGKVNSLGLTSLHNCPGLEANQVVSDCLVSAPTPPHPHIQGKGVLVCE